LVFSDSDQGLKAAIAAALPGAGCAAGSTPRATG
jgi:hypothetical protein